MSARLDIVSSEIYNAPRSSLTFICCGWFSGTKWSNTSFARSNERSASRFVRVHREPDRVSIVNCEFQIFYFGLVKFCDGPKCVFDRRFVLAPILI